MTNVCMLNYRTFYCLSSNIVDTLTQVFPAHDQKKHIGLQSKIDNVTNSDITMKHDNLSTQWNIMPPINCKGDGCRHIQHSAISNFASYSLWWKVRKIAQIVSDLLFLLWDQIKVCSKTKVQVAMLINGTQDNEKVTYDKCQVNLFRFNVAGKIKM